MSDTYTVSQVSQDSPKPWAGPKGTMHAYDFQAEEFPGKVFSINQKPETPALKAGDSFQADIKGTFQPHEGPEVTNLKRVYDDSGSRSNGGSASSRGGDDDATRRSIERQKSAAVASDLLCAMIAAKVYEPANPDALAVAHRNLTEQVYGSIVASL